MGESGTIDGDGDVQDVENLDEPDGFPAVASGADDSEPVRFADEIARRGDEVVLVTRTAAEAAALRDWGLLAVARPEDGRWCEAARDVFEGRDVVFIKGGANRSGDWSDPDVRVMSLIVRQIGFLEPRDCAAPEPRNDLAVFANDQRARGISPEALVREARESLFDVRALMAAKEGAGDADREPEPDWPPLRYGRPPAAEPFPVDVFPEPVARFVHAVAEAVGAPADFAGLAALVTAGAAIGRSTVLELKPGYRVAPALFGLNVGGPSSGTSPSLAAVVQPLRAIDGALQRLYGEELDRYEQAVREAKEAGRDKPAAPVLRSALLEDFSFETVVGQLARSPRGLLVACDDGGPWVASLARGTERRLWFSALRGLPLRIDQKRAGGAEGPTRLSGPFLAFCGNVSPGVLERVGERAEGFWERVLFAVPDAARCRPWSGRGLADEVQTAWADAIDRLYGPAAAAAATIAPRVVGLAADAQEEWARWYDARADGLNGPEADAVERAVDRKLCDFTARLALILHALDAACHPTRAEGAPLPPVSRSALERALRLGVYFRVHQRRARFAAGDRSVDGTARAIVDWLRRTGRTRFSVSTLKGSLRWLAHRPGEAEGALDWLEQRGAVARGAPTRPASRRGRPPSAVYAVHPELWSQARRELQENGPRG
ncbi:MAG: DUF3987 domain-containing protein [Isosphaeraceae bacterium]|nr:DUF3987 domain-containing protein [Isosphaeraceae bacterium]